jgi:hypothetical protein
MRRRLSAAVVFACLAAAQKTPTAEEILDRYVAVTGGAAARKAVRSEVMKAVAEVKAQGISGPTESYRDGKNYYMSMEIQGAGKIETGMFNGIVWQNSAIMGPRVMTGEEKAFYEREALLDKDVNWREIYRSATLAGEEAVDGKPAYKIILMPKDSDKPETRYYDKASGLLVRSVVITPSPMGDIPADQQFLDYRTVAGVKAPHKTVTRMGATEMSVTVTSIEFNKPIPASRFRPPPEVLTLAGKAGGSGAGAAAKP